jgi:2-amino-4-hydroxy-6-hydroxymethyldihydropteridine diphosphokinase
MSEAVLSIGSNLGDRMAYLRIALDTFGDRVRAVSALYETAPWGVTDQPDFLNAVFVAEGVHTPREWLDLAHRAESAAERVREQRWGPRTLDVDLIAVDDVRSDDPELILPHPRAAQRAFVLVPWLDVDPAAELPGAGAVAELLAALPAAEREGVRRTDRALS